MKGDGVGWVIRRRVGDEEVKVEDEEMKVDDVR